jgi:predicted CDP-diglyceride synthetase/phosphatidate cytidylyltransferase
MQVMFNAVGLKPGVPTALILVFGLLAIGSVIRFIALRGSDASHRRERLGSLAVWWIGLTLVSLIGFGGTRVAVIVFAFASWIGLREYFRLLDRMAVDATGRFVAFLAIPFTYAGIWWNNDLWFAISVPVVCCLLFAACLIGAEKTSGYLASVGSLT